MEQQEKKEGGCCSGCRCFCNCGPHPIECHDIGCTCHTHSTNDNKGERATESAQNIGGDLHRILNYTLHRKLTVAEYQNVVEAIGTLCQRGVEAERERWINQPANAHDEKIRQDERARIFAVIPNTALKSLKRVLDIPPNEGQSGDVS